MVKEICGAQAGLELKFIPPQHQECRDACAPCLAACCLFLYSNFAALRLSGARSHFSIL